MNIKDINIKDLINNLDFESNKFKKINDYLNLTSYQISVLDRMKIDYKNATSLNNLIYLINEAYEETLDEELEIILDEISERNYYENTNK
ncbi:MAG: hypothetical protein PHH51_02565 [Bacilli bacterium]|nr:hypothetical protein [Bacilli bacterium]MDD3895552.1 hypothetical protein [Bacilli bacterium]MDD4407818.1 hypothetical protein [Bacilli bacterium]